MTIDPLADRPLVSVIVIFRDEARFIRDAVESVLGQTYGDWELLLVDDGSVDASSEIARGYAAEHQERILYLHHPGHANRGMSSSRNLGIQHARGAYFAFLDGDDAWLPSALAEQVAILERHPEAGMVYGRLEYWYGWTGDEEDLDRDYMEPLGVRADTLIPPPGPLPLFLRDRAAVPSGLLVRREAALSVGGFEEAFRGEYEDQVFLAKLCLRFPVFAAGRCWYRYRQHPQSAVAIGQRTGATDTARLSFLTWLTGYLAGSGPRRPDVWWACHVELWRFTRPRVYHLVRHAQRLLDGLRLRLAGRASRP